MTHQFIVDNNEVQLVLNPINEVERLLLAQMLNNDLEVSKIGAHVSVLAQNVNGGIIIGKKTN